MKCNWCGGLGRIKYIYETPIYQQAGAGGGPLVAIHSISKIEDCTACKGTGEIY